jgi:hypothetical protein
MARAASDALGQGRRGQTVHDQRRRRGVADTHLAQRQDFETFPSDVTRDLDATLQGERDLVGRQSGLDSRVAGPSADLAGQEFRMLRQLRIDPRVDHPQLGADRAGEGIGAGLAGQEGRDHRLGDGGGIGRHAFGRQAVIAREDGQQGLVHRRRRAPGDQPQAYRQVLDAAQGAERLGLAVDQGAQPDRMGDVDRRDGRQGHQKRSRPAIAARVGMSKACSRAVAISSRAWSTRTA